MTTDNVKAVDLLLSAQEVRAALPVPATLAVEGGRAAGPSELLQSAAVDFAYRQFRGELLEGEKPLQIGIMSLVFDRSPTAARMIEQVASAAHIRTDVDGCDVAVETVTAPNGVVSYWGYIRFGRALVIVTIDTVDPQAISVADLRSIVSIAARRLHTVESLTSS